MLPIRDDVKILTYYRPPTHTEVMLGYDAIHYRDFKPEECCHSKDGKWYPKKWFKADDGLRYYR